MEKTTLTQNKIRMMLNEGKVIDSKMIGELIESHIEVKSRTLKLYERYKTDKTAVPIFTREFEGDANKINSKINNDFFSEVVDVKLGYLVGYPIIYNIDKNNYQDRKDDYNKHKSILSKLSIRNNFVDIDTELVKIVSICGHAGREIFVDKNGDIRVINLMPWETIFLTNPYGEVEYALRYYQQFNEKGKEYTQVEFFDSEKVSYFTGTGKTFKFTSENAHLFGTCPIVKVVNNEEGMGDCEKVLPLIDAYDRTVSDLSSEIEQFRLAYMYFKGKEPNAETIEQAKQTGGFYVGEDGEVGFITKQMADGVVENLLNRMEENILRFAKSVNFNDEQFGGTITGVAMKFKLFALEAKSSVMETKLQSALRHQFRIISKMLELKNIKLDYLDVFFDFKRNIPFNLQDEMQANATMVGLISERTRLSKLPFVDDIDYELRQMKMDREDMLNAYDDENYGDDEVVTDEQ